MSGAVDPSALLAGMTGDEAFSFLVRWEGQVDWDRAPKSLELSGGARVGFDKKRRSASIIHPTGGSSVIDLGRRDRMRAFDAIVTPDLTRVDGPEVALARSTTYGRDTAEVAVRDPLDRKLKRATTLVPAGGYSVSRFVDARGRTQLLAIGDLSDVSDFGTFLMDGGSSYAHLRTSSGLGCFYDASRATFMNAVTEDAADQARAEGFALVTTNAGPVGALFDCGEPGSYLALDAYKRGRGGNVGVLVDLRRPPVKDGAIVDPEET